MKKAVNKDMGRVAIATLGCKVNHFESEALMDFLEEQGYRLVPFGERADITIINTCTVTHRADFQSRQMARRASRANPESLLIVTGCCADVDPGRMAEIHGVTHVLGNVEKAHLHEILPLIRRGDFPKIRVSDIQKEDRLLETPVHSFHRHTRAFLKIQDGCNSRCSYCIARSAHALDGHHGRRQFSWASGGSTLLEYQKRNVLGLSTDFAEERTQASWGLEFTWQEGLRWANNNERDGLSGVDTFNLTISVDRPTFIRKLNRDRTFLLNSQLFLSYIGGYRDGMTADGPVTVLWLVSASTGYYQDRLLLSANVVWDFRSHSGALLPELQWRFTDDFSISLGAGIFTGGWSRRLRGMNDFSATDENVLSEFTYVENGLSPSRAAALARALRDNVERAVRGKPEVVLRALVCLLGRGHLLLEDVPGVGKTTLAFALARSLDASFRRVQFTSDLLPSDILGSAIPEMREGRPTGQFVFQQGPLFANVVLADEINRASPRTQSALLEAMREGQVSSEGVTRALPAPFLGIQARAVNAPWIFHISTPSSKAPPSRLMIPGLRAATSTTTITALCWLACRSNCWASFRLSPTTSSSRPCLRWWASVPSPLVGTF